MSAPTETGFANMTQRISWTAETNNNNFENGGSSRTINGYLLEISRNGGTTYSTLATINSASTNFYDEQVPGANYLYNTAYRIRITPSNECGVGRFPSPALSFTTDGVVPTEAPAALTVTVNNGDNL